MVQCIFGIDLFYLSIIYTSLHDVRRFFFSFHIWENLLSPFKKVVCIAAFEVLLSSYIIILDVIKFSLYNYSGSIEVLSYSLPCSQTNCRHVCKRKIALFLYSPDKIFCSHTYIFLDNFNKMEAIIGFDIQPRKFQ